MTRADAVFWFFLSMVVFTLSSAYAEESRFVSDMSVISDGPNTAPQSPHTDDFSGEAGLSEKAFLFDNTDWSIDLAPMADEELGIKRIPDVLAFSGGEMGSSWLETEGYGNCTVTTKRSEANMAIWECMQTKESQGVAIWRGEIHGNVIHGIVSRYRLKDVAGSARDFSFTGRRRGTAAGREPEEAEAGDEAAADRLSAGQSGEASEDSQAEVRVNQKPPVRARGRAASRPVYEETLDLLTERMEQLEGLRGKVAAMERANLKLKDENARLNEALKSKSEKLTLAEEELAKVDSRMAGFKDELDKRQEDLLQTRAALATAKAELKAGEDELSAARTTTAKLQEELLDRDELIKRNEVTHRDLDDVKRELQRANQEAEKLRNERQELSQQLVRVEEERATLRQQTGNQTRELESSRTQLASHQEALASLQKRSADLQRGNEVLQAENKGLKEALTSDRKSLSEIKRRAAEFEGRLSASRQETEKYHEELKQTKSAQIKAEADLQDVTAGLRDTQNIFSEKAAFLKQQNMQLVQDLELTKDRLSLQQRTLDERAKQLEALRQQQAQQAEENSRLASGLKEKEQALAAVRQDMVLLHSNTTDRDSARRQEIENRSQELAQLREQLATQQDQLAKANKDLQRLEQLRQALEADNARFQKEKPEQEKLLGSTSQELSQLRARVTQLENHAGALKKDLEGRTQRALETSSALAQATDQMAYLQASLERVTQSQQKLQAELAAAHQSAQQWKAKLAQREAELKKAESIISLLQKR